MQKVIFALFEISNIEVNFDLHNNCLVLHRNVVKYFSRIHKRFFLSKTSKSQGMNLVKGGIWDWRKPHWPTPCRMSCLAHISQLQRGYPLTLLLILSEVPITHINWCTQKTISYQIGEWHTCREPDCSINEEKINNLCLDYGYIKKWRCVVLTGYGPKVWQLKTLDAGFAKPLKKNEIKLNGFKQNAW